MEKLFNADHLKHLCSKYGFHPGKKYGQNYLIDETVIDDIIAAAQLSESDTVVEVGPGFGTLTLALASRVKKVIAFEIEKKLQPYWEESRIKNQELRNVEIVWGNVLKQLSDYKLLPTHYKLIANLPYQITSPVIRLFLEAEQPPAEIILMVQKEVAERICAKPGEMSLLSVAVQYYADAEIVRIVPRASFWPVPGVDSAVIRVSLRGAKRRGNPIDLGSSLNEGIATPRLSEARDDTDTFFKIVKAGFAQRRKLLIKNLEPMVGKRNKAALLEVFAAIDLTPQARAQELSLEQWKSLVLKIGTFEIV
jgi:16S rRNA (adenine1518-N6/adenine1519-N6)-dimethyltransferase